MKQGSAMAPRQTATPSTLDASLGPNLADISKHLYALFPPDFVQAYPDAQIEIAYGLPERGPEAARLFSAVNGIEAAAAFAYARSKAQCNCYVGPALRKAGLKGRAGKAGVSLTSFAWCDFDAEGDEERVKALLKEAGVQPAVLVQTGTIPNVRFQIYFQLDSSYIAAAIEPVNAALRNWLGGDDVSNADRVMRLAGTLSFPSQKKVERGYLIERTVFKLVTNAPRYSAEQLMNAAGENSANKTTREIRGPSAYIGTGNIGTGNGQDRVAAILAYAAETEVGRPLDELQEMLEKTQIEGQWHNNMLRVTASLIGKGWPEDAIRAFCGPYCKDGPNSRKLDPMLIGAYRKGWGGDVALPLKGTSSAITNRSRSYPSEQTRNDARHLPPDLSRAPTLEAHPYRWIDPNDVPRRDWLYGRQLIRKFTSATLASTGIGKTNLLIVEALAMVTSRPLLGVDVPNRLKVWLWNGEEPYEELQARIAAACRHYGIAKEELEGWLFVDSGRDRKNEIIIAQQTRNGVDIAYPIVDQIIATIKSNRIDVMIVDPFISSHRVTENDNNAIDMVAKEWNRIADVTNIGIDLSHHTRKTGGAEATIEDGRGASALLAAVRPARILNRMTEKEAEEGQVQDERSRYLKVAEGKNNLALPPDRVIWLRSASVPVGTPGMDNPEMVGVVELWHWPMPLAGVTGGDFDKVAAAIRTGPDGGRWRESYRANDWIGIPVAQALGLDLGDAAEKARVKGMIKAWIKAKSLVVAYEPDSHREMRQYVRISEVLA
jgi:hypothetical protein